MNDALDERRGRHLRWLGWLRLVTALAGVLRPTVVSLGHVPVSALLLYLSYRSPWYRRIGWFQVGGYDFVQLFLTAYLIVDTDGDAAHRAGAAQAALAVYGVMVLLSPLVLVRYAIAGAAASALPGAIALLHLADRDELIPVAVGLIAGCAAVALALLVTADRSRSRSSGRAGPASPTDR